MKLLKIPKLVLFAYTVRKGKLDKTSFQNSDPERTTPPGELAFLALCLETRALRITYLI